jgi:hypothetical protein
MPRARIDVHTRAGRVPVDHWPGRPCTCTRVHNLSTRPFPAQAYGRPSAARRGCAMPLARSSTTFCTRGSRQRPGRTAPLTCRRPQPRPTGTLRAQVRSRQRRGRLVRALREHRKLWVDRPGLVRLLPDLGSPDYLAAGRHSSGWRRRTAIQSTALASFGNAYSADLALHQCSSARISPTV